MLRDATPDDAHAIADIYAHYVDHTAVSFEEAPPSPGDLTGRIAASIAWVVLERDGAIAGYAYAGAFHKRAAYRWSVEVSVYVRDGEQRTGVGSALLDHLLVRLRAAGYVSALAGVTLPNAGSAGLFESRGFEPVARYANAGYKADAWHDVGWWQLALNEPAVPPREPIDA